MTKVITIRIAVPDAYDPTVLLSEIEDGLLKPAQRDPDWNFYCADLRYITRVSQTSQSLEGLVASKAFKGLP